MEEDISSNYMCYSMAKELWDNISYMWCLCVCVCVCVDSNCGLSLLVCAQEVRTSLVGVFESL